MSVADKRPGPVSEKILGTRRASESPPRPPTPPRLLQPWPRDDALMDDSDEDAGPDPQAAASAHAPDTAAAIPDAPMPVAQATADAWFPKSFRATTRRSLKRSNGPDPLALPDPPPEGYGPQPSGSGAQRRSRGLCEHKRQKSQCKECGGSGVCEHNRVKHKCKDCGGSSSGLCEHKRQKSRCKDCGGSGLCKHIR